MVAQIDKEKLPMIAFAVHPPGQPRRLARIGQAQGSASVGSVGVHQGNSCSRRREHARPSAVVKPASGLERARGLSEAGGHLIT
jgi:hypothetical protein